MQLPGFLQRLMPRSRRARQTEEARYAAAEELEKETQSHYRAVTDSDSSGQPTTKKPD
jgi:hypothetical protein